MRISSKLLLCTVLCASVPSLPGCGGSSSEIGPATTVPKVDPAKLEAERRKSMEKGGMTGPPPSTPTTTTQ